MKLAIPIALAAALLAWWLRWGCDDAYITFVYGRSVADGHGPQWFGTHIEGYTNFLWMLWSALGLMISVDPLRWSWALSIASLVATILGTFRLAPTKLAGLTAIGVLATNYTFLAFGTSGLETMLQAALLVAVYLEVQRLRDKAGIESMIVIGVYASLALMTRLDSAPMLLVLGIVTARRLVKANVSVRVWIAGAMPVLILVGGWFLWKLYYYGELLPNTFYAKADFALGHGLWFIGKFFVEYWLWLVIPLAIWRRAWLPLALVTAQLAYIALVGGDFMEFRFFVPLLPPLALAIGEIPRTKLHAALIVVGLGAASLRHGAAFNSTGDHSIDSIYWMANYYGKVKDNDWSQIGRSLWWLRNASISCNGAGAIPYNTDLPTIDQLGLNDEWVARHGVHAPADYPRPGHQRYATVEYLKSRGVTLVIGSPTYVDRDALKNRKDAEILRLWLDRIVGFAPHPVGDIEVVAAPIDDDREMLMWYLTPDPMTTAQIAGWDHLRLRIRD
ncbi:MAG: hypothetical protein QM831_01580 [Kofleriaceae bacterium]